MTSLQDCKGRINMANYTTNYNLKKPLGSELYNVAVQNENMDLIDAAMKANADAIAKDEEGIAYRLGNTNTTGATLAVGTYVYVTGNTNGVSNGMYKVTTAIAANGSLTTSNLGSVPGGVANSLNSNISTLSGKLLKYKTLLCTFSDGKTTIHKSDLTSSSMFVFIGAQSVSGYSIVSSYSSGDDSIEVILFTPTANGNTFASNGNRNITFCWFEY